MSQSSPADAFSAGDLADQRAPGPARAPRKRRVAGQLAALVAIPVVLGLALTGLRIIDAARSAESYSQTGRLAAIGRQVTSLAQAMEDERSATAAFIGEGRPATGLPALRRQYVITDGWAARVRRLVRQLGPGYPAQTRASTTAVLASIAELPGLRGRAAQGQATALAVTDGYAAATASLFPVSDGIADLSGNSALITSVRALGSLSRMIDQAALQQAILHTALAEGRFGPGALAALSSAQARQASDLASFRDSATPEESWALTQTLAGPQARQAQVVEQSATAAGNGPLALGAQASQQWSAGMSYTVGWMRRAEQQLTDWITAYTQAMRRSAIRSAIITGGAGLAGLALVLLVTVFVARSMARRPRRLDPAALDTAAPGEVYLPDEAYQDGEAYRDGEVYAEAVPGTWELAQLRDGASAISANFFQRSHSLLELLLRQIDSMELSEDDPERLAGLFQLDHLASRMWRNSDSALVLAGHQTSRHPAEPLSLVDVLRAAVSEIEQYDRVMLNVQQGVSVSESAATDTVHLLAELLENATRFSPKTAQVVVSGHLVRGGGSLITIADGGPGIPEEQLRQLNWQLAHPSLTDAAVADSVGLFAVAHLAARHEITVSLSERPDGGTTAEVFLPAALITPDTTPGSWPRQAGETLRTRAGEGADAWVSVAELPFSALRFAAGPEPPLEPETDLPEAIPLELGVPVLGAPVPSPAIADPAGVPLPDPAGAEPGGVLPIFESVEAGHFRTFGRGLLRVGDPPATAAESAEIMRSRLTSFQRGSRRARTAAQRSRGAKQPGQDG